MNSKVTLSTALPLRSVGRRRRQHIHGVSKYSKARWDQDASSCFVSWHIPHKQHNRGALDDAAQFSRRLFERKMLVDMLCRPVFDAIALSGTGIVGIDGW